jgi:ribose-phosphate pyrophosphokinase
MKTLNLVYPEKSDIKYRIDKFPDGQQQVISLDKNPHKTGRKLEHFISNTNRRYLVTEQIVPVQIKARLNNFRDLELIVCATKSLRNLGVKDIHLYTPYFMGARSDRQFEEGSNNYLKDVICPIINSLSFESVTVLDPHSDVLEACLNNFRKESNINLVYFTMNHLRPLGIADDYALVSPDAGASKKIYKIAEQIGYKGDIITCSKSRDVNGDLTDDTVVPWILKEASKDLIIIDDICDGGATFINIAKTARDEGYIGKFYLVVTHGIFSKGFEELSKYFDGIYCTNSYSDLPKWQDQGDKIITANHLDSFVKQLNVF